MRTMPKLTLVLSCFVVLGSVGHLASGQTPIRETRPDDGITLGAVSLVNVAVNGVARALESPTGLNLGAEFLISRNGPETIEVNTSGGSSFVSFSHVLPAGVPASAFAWEQVNVPTPRAKGRLRFNGCDACPASISLQIRVASGFTSASGTVKIKLTESTARPTVASVVRSGGTEVEPRYEITFAQGTFNLADGEAIASYTRSSGNFKYKLLPETNNATATRVFVVIPRLTASRTVGLVLKNAYGASSSTNVSLPIQQLENGPGQFNCVDCSTVFGEALIRDEYSVKHNSGVLGASGNDEIVIKPLRTGTAPCNEPDVLFNTASVRWIETTGFSGNSADQGTVSVASQPPVGEPLRSPQNRIRIAWSLKPLKGDRWYQITFGSTDVLGVCSARVVQ